MDSINSRFRLPSPHILPRCGDLGVQPVSSFFGEARLGLRCRIPLGTGPDYRFPDGWALPPLVNFHGAEPTVHPGDQLTNCQQAQAPDSPPRHCAGCLVVGADPGGDPGLPGHLGVGDLDLPHLLACAACLATPSPHLITFYCNATCQRRSWTARSGCYCGPALQWGAGTG